MSSSLDLSSNGIRGPLSIGCSIFTLITGIGLMQAFSYFRNVKKDPMALKLLIGFVTSLETFCTAMAMYYQYLMLNWDIEEGPTISLALFTTITIVGATVVHSVQAYFIWRLHRLLHLPFFAYSMWLLTLLCYAVIFGVALQGALGGVPYTVPTHLAWMIPFTLFLDATVDISVSSMLVQFFRTRSKNSGFSGTKRLLDRLSLYSIENCLFTSVFAVIDAVVYLSGTAKGKVYFLAFQVPLPSLFFIALLASMNSREALQSQRSGRSPSTGISLQIAVETSMEVQQESNSPDRRKEGFSSA